MPGLRSPLHDLRARTIARADHHKAQRSARGNEAEIASETVGKLVMEGLKALAGVAYVRYASVYRDFREAKDFHRVLGELGDNFNRAPDET